MLARWQLLAIVHALIIGPLLIALGEAGKSLPNEAFSAVAIVAIIIAAYHTYRYFTNGMRGINLFHILVVAPVLLYIGIRGKSHAGFAFPLATMIGFAAIGYNLLNLIKY